VRVTGAHRSGRHVAQVVNAPNRERHVPARLDKREVAAFVANLWQIEATARGDAGAECGV
jgi:hypothetical protein